MFFIRDNKYYAPGSSYTLNSLDSLYEKHLKLGCYQTETLQGKKEWDIFSSEDEIKKLDNVENVKRFHSKEFDSDFYFVVFK